MISLSFECIYPLFDIFSRHSPGFALTVDGNFWGKLNTVHNRDTHTVNFSGTRILGNDIPPDLMVDPPNTYSKYH